MKTIGERIKDAREELGMTPYDLAKVSGVSAQLIYRYENGEIKDVSLTNVEKLAKVLRMRPGVLVGWEAPMLMDEEQRHQKLTQLIGKFVVIETWSGSCYERMCGLLYLTSDYHWVLIIDQLSDGSQKVVDVKVEDLVYISEITYGKTRPPVPASVPNPNSQAKAQEPTNSAEPSSKQEAVEEEGVDDKKAEVDTKEETPTEGVTVESETQAKLNEVEGVAGKKPRMAFNPTTPKDQGSFINSPEGQAIREELKKMREDKEKKEKKEDGSDSEAEGVEIAPGDSPKGQDEEIPE